MSYLTVRHSTQEVLVTVRNGLFGLAVALLFGLALVSSLTAESFRAPQPLSSAAQAALVKQYCVTCHNEAQKAGGLSLETFDGTEHLAPNIAILVTQKLKAGQMPPPGMPRPDDEAVQALLAALESVPGGETTTGGGESGAPAGSTTAAPRIPFPHTGDKMTIAAQNAMVHQICTQCHTDKRKPGGLSFEHFDMAAAPRHAKVAENMIAKLRAGMMPRPAPRMPDQASIHAFVVSLEARIDRAAARPDPGSRTFQRLNQAEYADSIRTMLGLSVDVSQWLPPDTMSHNFDNIAEAQNFSPTLLQSYLDAAYKISQLAVGNPHAGPTSTSYRVSPTASQMNHVPGAPLGTRGGLSVVHIFPADGFYRFKFVFVQTDTRLFGSTVKDERIELSVDGRRVALLTIDPRMDESSPQGLGMQTPEIEVTAGPHRISASFPKRFDGPIDDLLSPHRYTLADPNIGNAQGITTLPHLRSMTVVGPFRVTGVSDTISRRKIFICRPATLADETPCAERIVGNLARQAYRRPLTSAELQNLMHFYDLGRKQGDFESGVRTALQAMLASPRFLFRLEPETAAARPGQNYRIDDLSLASRLSYFLWATSPDAALMKLAREGRLHEPAVIGAQVKRMLQDPRSYALSTRFAAQWLRLQDVDKVRPDALAYPQYDATLGDYMKQETEHFFDGIVKNDRSVMDLLTADYSYVNGPLAKYYGIPHVAGPRFRKVSLEGTHRRGILGQGSILVETSVADRSDPVLRGKWVLEVLLGQPPPPPPPGVNTNLDDSAKAVQNGRTLSVRERMEQHRANPFCASCHRVIDPIGLALENFDPTGHWRIKDNGVPVDASTTLYDGTAMVGLPGLEQAMLAHQDTFLRVFTENLMAYAIGRPVEYSDMPSVRAIVRRASLKGNRFSSFVIGIVNSPAFRMNRAAAPSTDSKLDRQRNHGP